MERPLHRSGLESLARALAGVAALVLVVVCAAVAQAATVTSFAPAGGPANTYVTIRGTGFTGATAVQFNGIGASWGVSSDSVIWAYVPGTAASGPIRVFNGATFAQSPTSFFVGYTPYLGSFTPQGGAPGTSVTLNGAYFSNISAVRFNGVSASFTVNSTSQITATVPVGATTGSITVTNPAGAGSNGTFWLPPQITSVSPQGAQVGAVINVNGANMSIVSSVTFNGVAGSIVRQTDTQLGVSVPNGATTGALVLNSFAGTATVSFFVGAVPTIASLTPAGGPAGTVVTVSGTGFTGISAVDIGGVAAGFSVTDANTMMVTIPAGATTGYLNVTNPVGTAHSLDPFYVGVAPVVSGLTPAMGPVGSMVQIAGSHFTGATSVRFAGGMNASSFVVNSDASIQAVVPPLAQTGPIEVRNPAGTGTSVQSFGLSPTLLNFTPTSVPEASATGTSVTLTGYNLNDVYDVQFNGVLATLTHVDDQHLTAYVPTGATTGPITVTSLFGGAVSAVPFTIVHFDVPQRVPGVGWPHWPEINVPVAVGSRPTYEPVVVADSTGGSFIAWYEHNGSNYDIRLQHLDAFGRRVTGWPSDGVQLGVTPGDQHYPRMVADQVGGVIVTWWDSRAGDWDVYAQRITGAGAVATGWPAGGLGVAVASSEQSSPFIATDGAGGALIAWQDFRNGNYDVYAQHLLPDGGIMAGWPANGLAVCTQGSHQYAPSIVRTLTGGAYVAWRDSRYGAHYPHLLRLEANGSVASGWPADGVFVSGNGANQAIALILEPDDDVLVGFTDWCCGRPCITRFESNGSQDPLWPTNGRILGTGGSMSYLSAMVSDGQGGAYFAWNNGDMLVARVLANGALAPSWPSNPLNVTPQGADQIDAVIAPDGQGGAYLAWGDSRNGSYDIYGMRVAPTGQTSLGWTMYGAVTCLQGNEQRMPAIAADGLGGVVVAWRDARNSDTNSYDIYAQNLGPSGRLGNPEPLMTGASDVPSDQGGKVRIKWQPGYLDSLPVLEIASYGIWRQTTEQAMTAALGKSAAAAQSLAGATDDVLGRFKTTGSGATITYWEGLGSIPARGQNLYSFVASTLADSGSAGVADETYMVDAHAQFGGYFWTTANATAHSVDNLPPNAPVGFAGVYAGATTRVHWKPNTERDLAGYRLYRGTDPHFVPEAANMIAQLTDTAYTDVGGGAGCYKLEAVDTHGNRSAAMVVLPPAVAGVGGEGIERAAFSAPQPNPARRDARFQLMLPRPSRVTIGIFDATGRKVRQLLEGVVASGANALVWDLTDADGKPVPAGLYFAHAQTDGLEQRRRIVVVR